MSKGFNFSIKISALDQFSGKFANMSKSLDRFGKKATKLGQSLSLGLTAPIIGLGAMSIKNAADIEQMTIALEGMTGGAEGAKKMMQELMQFSASTPFQLEGISDAARMLLATEKIQVNEIQDALKVAGDIAAGSKSQIQEIAYVMSKAASKGRADMEILNMFLERGIPIMGSLTKETGKNQIALEKMISKGQLSYDILYKSMMRMTEEGGVFENMMEKQSQSIKGLFSTLQDNLKLMSAAFGDAIIDSTNFDQQISSLTLKVQELAGWFSGLSPELKSAIVWTGIFASALGPVLMTVGQIAIGLGLMVTYAGAIGSAFAFIGLTLLPWTAAFAFIGYLFYKLQKEVGGMKNAFKLLGAIIFDFFVSPIRLVAQIINKVWSLFASPPAFLQKMAGGFLSTAVAQDIYNDNREIQRQKSELNIKFENAPKGMRAEVKSETNADVSVEQGIGMEGGY